MLKKQNIIIIICVIIFFGLGFLGNSILKSSRQKDLGTEIKQENKEWQENTYELRNKITALEKEISILSNDSDTPDENIDDSFEEPGLQVSNEPSKKPLSNEDIERNIASFFMHLDKQGYVKQHKLKGSSYNEYEKIIKKISEKTPLISNETESLYNMFLNIAHFYRVIGKDQLFFTRDILLNENSNIESTMKDFFLWYTFDLGKEKRIKGIPSQKVLYEYAAFFLNTIGGRNYLMRRDSKLRILTSYYSILILDRTNDIKQNPNGIDIRPYLRLVLSDISNQRGFIFHSEYLKTLNELMKKYGSSPN